MQDQSLLENDEKSTPQEERSSKEPQLDDLFEDEEETTDNQQDKSTEDETVEQLKKRLAEMEKGIKKLASQMGRQKSTPPTAERTPSYLEEEVLLARYPEAQNVMEEIKTISQETGKSPLELFRESSFLQNEARARAEQKKKEEENKAKLNAPSSSLTDGSISFDEIDLSNKEHVKWLWKKEGRVDAYNQWLKKHYKK